MGSFEFWRKWLLYSSFFFAFVGVAIALAGNSILFQLWNGYFAEVFGNSAEVNAVKEFMSGPLGGTIFGSYILLAFIAKYPFKKRERWAWNAATLSLLAWFIVDSSVSFHHEAYFNIIIINLFTLVVQGLPLIFTRKYFNVN